MAIPERAQMVRFDHDDDPYFLIRAYLAGYRHDAA
jgi:hypothetical protein